jgi:hypothetical protein
MRAMTPPGFRFEWASGKLDWVKIAKPERSMLSWCLLAIVTYTLARLYVAAVHFFLCAVAVFACPFHVRTARADPGRPESAPRLRRRDAAAAATQVPA